MTGAVHLSSNDGIATLHLDNPARLNAFTPDMLRELAGHCDTIDGDKTVHAVLVTAEGDRAFCAGADIKAWGALSPFDFARDWVRGGHRIFDRLARLHVPTVAVIHAHAFGGGLELAAACDLRIMAPAATLALPETQVGIVPGWSGTHRVARLIPEPILKEMVLFGRRLTAERALACGFVAELADQPLIAARDIVAKLQDTSPRATEVAKYLIHAAVGEDRSAVTEALGGGMIAASADKAEGVAAFAEKRKPAFSGS